MNKTFRASFLPLLVSLVFSGIWIAVGGFLYHALKGVLWTPLLIALYLTGLAAMLFVSILVSNALGNNAKPNQKEYIKALLLIAAIFLGSMLFEFLYELDGTQTKPTKPSSYIFLIDDSGSMNVNDPDSKRYDAVYEVLKGCDGNFPFALYSFTEECQQISGMAPASSAAPLQYDIIGGGGTDIELAVQRVLDDIASGELAAGNAPRIVLLSDGESYFYDYRGTVNACLAKNVSVSTVGFAYADESELKNLANDTRGTFVWAEDVSHLATAMNTAAKTYLSNARDLLGRRPHTEKEGLLAALRILFLLVLAAGFVAIKICLFSTFDRKNIALYTFIVLAVLGAVLPELTNGSLLSRGLLCLFFGILFGSGREQPPMPGYPGAGSSYPGASMAGVGNSFGVEGSKWNF